MQGDEMEMTKEELQKWIRKKVQKNKLIVAEVEKCNLLRSLLRRRENQAIHLRQLHSSVAACETLVKKYYSLLGWEYKDTCSDDEMSTKNCEKIPPSTYETHNHGFSSTNGPTPPSLKPLDSVYSLNGKSVHVNLNRQPVVVLTRLSPCLISSLCSPASESSDIEDENIYNSDSDTQWEPDEDMGSDSDFSSSNDKPWSKKRRKMDSKEKKCERSFLGQHPGRKDKASASSVEANTNRVPENKTPEKNVPNKGTKTHDPSGFRGGEICVNMTVLARNRVTGWQVGKIMKIVTKEHGRQKYKISFEDKSKSLVSGHHMAFDNTAQLDELSVGSRVVVECEDRALRFRPGIVAELPSCKNRKRFLVFFDDHTPVYVPLTFIHSVCKPLKNPLEDIENDTHKNFLKEYLNVGPHLPLVQYRVGQTINAKLNGVQQTCEVLMIDSSLIQVIFQRNGHEDWIYRGSPRLEHVIMRNQLVSNMGRPHDL